MRILYRPLLLGALSSVLCLLAACNLPEPQADTVRHFTLGGGWDASQLPR